MLYLCVTYLCFTVKIEAGMRLRMRLADSVRAEPDALHMLTVLIEAGMCLRMRLADSIRAEPDALHICLLYLCFAYAYDALLMKQACASACG
jgi:hypothetical protein